MFKFYKDEKGNGLLLFSLFFMILVGISGVVVDAGMLYKTKAELRKTVNAAALSGAQELPNSESAVTLVVQDILKAHNEEESLKELFVKPNGENKVTVTLEKNVPLTFMKLFNMDSTTINASASAAIAPMTKGPGAVPLGIDKNTPLEYMKEYKLKVDAGGSIYGNFGILALSGVGANLYEQDLMYGYDSELEIGDIIPTQTGNIEGKTRNGVNYRINLSGLKGYDDDDYSHRDDPRVILILVYEPYEVATNQLKSVKICGFAYFYLKESMNRYDSSITGYFIQRVGVGTGDVNAKDNGAYAIKLVE